MKKFWVILLSGFFPFSSFSQSSFQAGGKVIDAGLSNRSRGPQYFVRIPPWVP